MTTSTQRSVPATDADVLFDCSWAAFSTVTLKLGEPPPRPRAAADLTARSSHVVQGIADGLLNEVPAGWRAQGRALAMRTTRRMIATSEWLPLWLAACTVVGMYGLAAPATLISSPGTPLSFVLLGLGAGLLLWLGVAAATNGAARADRANARSYAELLGRMTNAEAAIERRVAEGRLAQDAAPVAELGALKARLHAHAPDADWASGMGYVNAWRDLHRIEEALVAVADGSELDGMLRHDELRIEGSKLNRNDSVVRRLVLDTRKRLDDEPGADVRSSVSTIRQTVNDFRDRRFEALVRNRMYVDQVSLLLGLSAWALLCLAILAGADKTAVASVAALYLIGAATGLFTQLRSGFSESLEDVFGYGQATLRQTLLLSGLAGVAGVFLTAVVGAAALANAATPATEATLSGALGFTAVTAVTAAAFGLAPGTLTDKLNEWAKTNIKDLESTTNAGEGR